MFLKRLTRHGMAWEEHLINFTFKRVQHDIWQKCWEMSREWRAKGKLQKKSSVRKNGTNKKMFVAFHLNLLHLTLSNLFLTYLACNALIWKCLRVKLNHKMWRWQAKGNFWVHQMPSNDPLATMSLLLLLLPHVAISNEMAYASQ